MKGENDIKKIVISILVLIGIVVYFTIPNNTSLEGFYQSKNTSEGYTVQISIDTEENNFVEYINNREVNRGTYELLGSKNYKLVGDSKVFEISLSRNNSFEIIIKKLNDGNPIVMKNVSVTPVYYPSNFDDIEKYKSLIK